MHFVRSARLGVSLAVAILALIVASAVPAAANSLVTAKVTDNCTQYTISLTSSALTVGKNYTVSWQILGLSSAVNDQVSFTAKSKTYTTSVTKTWASYGVTPVGSVSLSGTATMVGRNTINLAFTRRTLSCALPLSVGCASSTASAGSNYSSSITVTGGTSPYKFAVTSGNLPDGLNLDPNTGVISGIPTTPGTSNYTVTVTDAKGLTASTSGCGITVNASPLTIKCIGQSNGVVGQSFNGGVSAAGGTAPYTYVSIFSNVPPGLTLNSDGTITGIPQQSGTYVVRFQVTDHNGVQADTSCTIVITDSPNPLGLNCPKVTTGSLSNFFDGFLTATGGSGVYTSYQIISGNLPDGLNLNSATGEIMGTATKAGAFSFTAQVKDSNGATATVNCTITISTSATPPQITLDLPFIQACTYYNLQPTVTGGTPPYTWAVTAGSLPAGMSLNAATGEVVGSPISLSSSTFTLTVTDSTLPTAQTASSPFTITPVNTLFLNDYNASQDIRFDASNGNPIDGNTFFYVDLPEGLGGTAGALLSGSGFNYLRVNDIVTGTQQFEFDSTTGGNYGPGSAASDGTYFYIPYLNGGITKYDLNGNVVATNNGTDGTWQVAINPFNPNELFATDGWANGCGRVDAYDKNTLQYLRNVVPTSGYCGGNGQLFDAEGIAFAADGSFWVANGGYTQSGAGEGGNFVVHYANDGTYLGQQTDNSLDQSYAVNIRPDGTVLVTNQGSDCVTAFDPAGVNPPYTLVVQHSAGIVGSKGAFLATDQVGCPLSPAAVAQSSHAPVRKGQASKLVKDTLK